MAQSLMSRGYEVTIFTPFFDPDRDLAETALHNCTVTVRGNFFPASIFGCCKALCANIRMLLCAIYVVLFAGAFECYILDQVSLPIPLLRCRNRRVIFYCLHPDKQLMAVNRGSIIIQIYRLIIDYIEELTTGMAHTILVNSQFTKKIF